MEYPIDRCFRAWKAIPDETSLLRLYRSLERSAGNAAFAILGHADSVLACELATDVLLSIGEYPNGAQSFSSWVYGRFRWRILDHARSRKEYAERNVSLQDGGTLLLDIPRESSSYASREALIYILRQLDRTSRRILVLMLRGYSQTEIAERLEIQPFAVRKRWERIRKMQDIRHLSPFSGVIPLETPPAVSAKKL